MASNESKKYDPSDASHFLTDVLLRVLLTFSQQCDGGKKCVAFVFFFGI